MSIIINKTDTKTGALTTIDYAHHEIHGGSSFTYHDVIASLADTVVQDYWFITPDTTKYAHIGHSVESVGPITLEIFEGADRTNAKTEQTCYNRDRNSATVNTTKIYKNNATGTGAGGTTDGVRLIWWKGGVTNNKTQNGTDVGTTHEKILKRNTKYIFRITSGMAANLISVSFDWYEHTNLA
jgi:hypothetical protein